MLGLEINRRNQDRAAVKFFRENRLPYIPWDEAEIKKWREEESFPFPNLGDSVPKGWDKTNLYFSIGQECPDAEELCQEILACWERHPEYGYAICHEDDDEIIICAYRPIGE